MRIKVRLLAPVLLLVVFALGAGRVLAQESHVTFHFYGAKDCPPCMAFKRDGLPIVQAAAAKSGFRIAVNIIDRTQNVATLGSYGSADAMLRRAGVRLKRMYPPIFFVTRSGQILDVHDANWRAALARAKQDAKLSVGPEIKKSEK